MASAYDVLISLRAQNQASSVIKAVQSDLGGLAAAVTAPTNAIGGMVSALGRIGLAVQGVQSLISPFQGLAQGIVAAGSSTESFRVGLDRMAGSAQQAEAFYQDLVRFAAQTPFELSGLQDQTRRLAAVGFSLNEVIPLLKITGDAVATLGGTSVQLDRVTLAISQMHTRGKVSMQELNQLAEAGIPAFRLLAEGFGVTQAQMAKMIESGTVPADKSIRILLEGMQKMPGAAGAMGAQSQTLAGRLSNLQDAVYQLQAGIGGALGDAIKIAISGLGDLVQNIQSLVVPVLQRYGPQIAQAIGPVVQQGVKLATDAMTTFVGVVVGAGPSLARAVGAIAGVFQTGLSATLSVVVTMAQAIYGALQYLNPFARHSPSLVESVQDGVTTIGEAFGGLSGPVVAAVAGARDAMTAFRETVGDMASSLSDQLPKSLSAAIALLGQGARPAFLDMQRAIEDANAALDDQKRALDDQKAALVPYKDAVDDAKRALVDQQSALRDTRGALKDAQDALDPLKQRYDDLTQAVKDADAAIRDLQSTPLQGEGDFERRTTEATNAVRTQEKALNDLKRSDAYRTLGQQIEDTERKIADARLAPDDASDALRDRIRKAQDDLRAAQRVDVKSGDKGAAERKETGVEQAQDRLTRLQREQQDATEKGNDALEAQRRQLELLKRRQDDLVAPRQKELDQSKGNLEAIRLEKATAIDAAEDRLKTEGRLAQGINERSEGDLTGAIRAAGAAKTTAEAQLKDVVPAYEAQQKAVEDAKDAVALQEKAVADAQDAVTDATRAYDDHKKIVDDLSAAYATAKQEVAGYEAELRQTIATAKQAAQAQAEAAAAAKKAAADAKTAAKDAGGLSAPGPEGGIIPTGTIGVPPETKQQLDDLKKKADDLAKSFEDVRKRDEDFGKGIDDAAKRAKAALTDLGERLKPIVTLIEQNAVPIFAAVAAVLGTSWVIAIGAAILAINPLTLAIAGIGAAVFLLTKAWTENWGDIQGKTAAVWSVLGPILATLGGELMKFVTEVLPEFGKAWAGVTGAIGRALDGIAALFSGDGADGLKTGWRRIWEDLGQLLVDGVKTWGALFGGAWRVYTGIVFASLKVLQGDWAGAWRVLSGSVDEALKGIGTALGRWKDSLGTLIGQLAQNFYDWSLHWSEELWRGFWTGFSAFDLGGKVTAWFTEHLLLPVTSLLGVASPSTVFAGYGADVIQGLWDGIAGWAATLPANLAQWVTDNVLIPVKTALGIGGGEGDVPQFGKIGGDLIAGLWGGIAGWANDFKTNIGTWFTDNLLTPVKTLLGVASPSTVFLEIGKETIQGLWNGILGWAGDLLKNVQQFFVDNVINPVRAIFGIPEEGAPAVVFVRIALDTIAGLIQGLGDKLSDLVQAAKDAAAALIDAMKEQFEAMKDGLRDSLVDKVKSAIDAARKFANDNPVTTVVRQVTQAVAGRGGGDLAADLPPISPGILGLPLRGPISQGYGQTQFSREHPQFYAGAGHDGIDIVAGVGTPVGASGVGRVTKAGFDRTGYGNLVEIVHNGISTFYGHLDSIRVAIGQIVAAGEIIGTVGMTGNTTGPHLHLGAKDHGRSIDPRSVIAFATGGLIREPVVGVGKSGKLYTLGEREDEQTAVVPSSAFRRQRGGRAPAGTDYSMEGDGGKADYRTMVAAFREALTGLPVELRVQGAEDLIVWGTVTAQRRGRL